MQERWQLTQFLCLTILMFPMQNAHVLCSFQARIKRGDIFKACPSLSCIHIVTDVSTRTVTLNTHLKNFFYYSPSKMALVALRDSTPPCVGRS